MASADTIIESESCQIQLTRGYFSIVDAADYDWLTQWKWHANDSKGRLVYAERNGGVTDRERKIIMHRVITNAPKGMEVDHRDGDGLNNRRSNLRLCTHSENMKNKSKVCNTSSQYKGVYWSRHANKWKATITLNKTAIHLGYYDKEHDACLAYNLAAVQYFGPFAKINLVH